ncbi:TonB-dependent receptor plug domain-containing protein [Runella sp. MFBS21]|uniref:TonB-dependent receptor plug domain-containing protein n=1 Tax=Runella sp. MFBS21 TaxID=3034018 RepID=UPI0023F63C07|nr:TonB-dependent receptor plug domain-containing protein [Runella sp. MFBS21]MDF7818497.1 TonB-dependent receptor plug domain-containing protein [Runella sp. MFBS21]
MKKKWQYTWLLCVCSLWGYTQGIPITIFVSDSITQQALPKVGVAINTPKPTHFTNEKGQLIITTKPGNQRIRITHADYIPWTGTYTMWFDTVLTVKLVSKAPILDEVIIRADLQEKLNNPGTGLQQITHNQLEKVPALLGEKDIVKALQLTPGVKAQTEGSSAMYVRGGSADQNLFLLNGTPLYYTSHLFGLLTPYNPDILAKASLYKGDFPAWYGGRLSSVLDVSTRSAHMQTPEREASIGLLSARALIGQPIIKNKLSLLMAGRRSFLDALLLPNPESPTPRFGFYDVDSKLSFHPNSTHHFDAFLHIDQDFWKYHQNLTGMTSRTDFQWQNRLGGLSWNYHMDANTSLQAEASVSVYRMRVNSEKKGADFTQIRDFRTGLTDYSLKMTVQHQTSSIYHQFGIHYTLQKFNPGTLVYQLDSTKGFSNRPLATTFLLSVFDQGTLTLTPHLKLNAGLRLSLFKNADHTYFSPEPRLSLHQQFSSSSSMKLSFSRMQQPLHLLSNPSIGVPLDLWLPATNGIAPAIANQVSLGYFKQINIPKNPLTISLETYYKDLRHVVSYQDGHSSTDIIQFGQYTNPSVTDFLTVGKGRAYGLEVFIEKKGKRFSGWMGYTLAWTQQKFSDLNQNRWFYPTYDRRHDISISLSYQLTPKWRVNTNWVYGTGQPVTLPVLYYDVPNFNFTSPSLPNSTQLMFTQGERNAYRMLPYHRLDLSLQRTKTHRWGQSTFEIGIYNVYNRRNPFFYQLSSSGGKPTLQSVALFPLLPSFSYSLKWGKFKK